MAMELLVRVRGVADASSFNAAFRSLGAASVAANRQVEAAAARSGRATQSIYRESARAAVQAADAAASAAEKSAAAEVRSKERALARVAAIRERYFREEQRRGEQAERAAERSAQRQERASAAAAQRQVQMLSGAARTFGSLARTGLSTLGSVAMGMGVDLSLGGGLGRAMSRNSTAIALSTAAYKDGGPRESVAGLEAQAMATGSKYKIDPTGVIEGLAQYQKLTGDLATGKAGLEGLTALAGATTTKLEDMFAAAGNVGNALGEVGAEFKTPEEKAKAVLEVMKGVAAFGQEGAVEISDLAKQMAKVSAAAGFFEGDRSGNLLKMTALAQLARQSGGAASATQAATSVLSFANILRTPARRAQFKEAGIDVDSATQKGQLRDPISIIKEALTKTGGAIEPMKKLFANVMGDKPVTALATAYNKAGGGDAGMKAVDAMLAKFGGTMSDSQIASNNAERMKGTAAQGVEFQIELDKITSAMGTELAPAMKDLAPVALSAAKSLAGIVTFGAQNPGLMITGALIASIGKAAVGEAVGKAVGGMLSSVTASHVGLGLLAAAAIAAAVAIEDYEAKSNKEKGKAGDDSALIAKAEKQFRETGKIDKETIDQIAQRRAEIEGQRGALKTGGVEDLSFTQILAAKVTGGADQVAAGEGATRDAKEQGSQKLDVLAAKMDQLIATYGKTMRVHVENAGDLRGPSPGPTPNPGSTVVP